MRLTPPVLAALFLAANAALPRTSVAQDGYLFQAPKITLSLKAGTALPTANGPLYRFFTDELTLERRDFASTTYGLDVAVRLTPRVDMVASVSLARINRPSEFRDWVDQNDEAIEQTTKLKRMPITVGARVFARERGRSVGKFAWVPQRLLPYAGAAVGVMWYELEQEGWFVDHETLDIFPDYFEALGNAPLAQVFGGTEWWPFAQFGLTLEGRFTYAKAALRADFVDYDNIDLSGFQLMAGVSARF